MFHFSSYVPFLPFFFFSVLQMNPSCHYFQFYPHWPFKNPPRRTPRPFELSAELKTHCLCCYIIISSSWAGQFYTLFFSTLPYLSFTGHPSPSLLRSVIHTFLVKFQCTFHLKKSGTSGHQVIIPINKIIIIINRCNRR